ncbi:MAG: malonic semialdehyde reductase [Vicinamibacteria bacterium]|nr:malonic semialdehyde reductase [Vicinamibacteria bacterium]
MDKALDTAALDQIFRTARTFNGWQKKDVSDALLRELYDLAKMGPTSLNCLPMRLVFVKSEAAKERLKPCLMSANVDKTMAAPVTAIVGHDLEFYEHLPRLFPHLDARAWFVGQAAFAESTAFRNGSLQGAYLILAARALGLDCGPMSGFDSDKVDAAFFPGGRVRTNFLVNLGYGEPQAVYPRGPRFAFDEVCRIE